MSLFRKKPIDTDLAKDTGLKRVLGPLDLTLLGIGAIIGAGIFVLTGRAAAADAGPAIVLSFVIAGIACACAALAYAELASSVGGAGSAYAYGYAGLGEFPAWIIGWLLILEYTVAISTVAVGWSGYFNDGLRALFGTGLPDTLLHGPWEQTASGAPGIINLPAVLIIALLGALLAGGAKISAQFNAIMVFVKVSAILLFLAVAFGHIDPANWSPFVPDVVVDDHGRAHYGWQGVLTGAATIFFAYIGFDAVSTAAEECRNPQRDLPIGIIASLAVCTVLYIAVSGTLTGIVHYSELLTASPVSTALLKIGESWAAGMISIGAIAGLTTVMLVLYYAITRILFAISRDGLLPPFFAHISPHTKSPTRVILMLGIIMGGLGGFLPLQNLAELTNIGTLGAFVVVCAGVIVLRRTHPDLPRGFKTPFGPVIPLLGIVFCLWLMVSLRAETWRAFGVWLVAGLLIYFLYSRQRSVLAQSSPEAA
ncbi:MAG TPA: amino acid permease [Gammaproteobacteria bacterium]|nr:amino acid permease [Gammaproteobacteria bacterium]